MNQIVKNKIEWAKASTESFLQHLDRYEDTPAGRSKLVQDFQGLMSNLILDITTITGQPYTDSLSVKRG